MVNLENIPHKKNTMKILKIIVLLIPILILIYSTCFEPYQLESSFHEVTIGKSGKGYEDVLSEFKAPPPRKLGVLGTN
jgi:hypothetical protein